jgi:polar amino acid transport system permease protein
MRRSLSTVISIVAPMIEMLQLADLTFKNTNVFTLVALMYLTMSSPPILLVRHFEKRANRR